MESDILAKSLTPAALIDGTPYLLAALILVFVCVVLIWLITFLWKPRKPQKNLSHPRHIHDLTQDEWVERIHKVTVQYHDGGITQEDAFAEFARISRLFATDRLGVNFLTHTLIDIRKEPRTSAVGHFEAFRQTIEALYPAEFANPQSAITWNSMSVEDGEKWVSRLVEEWRQ
jgi:hypothetical protein